jgi:hypothetical protein
VLAIGLDQNDRKVWEQWGVGRADDWKYAPSWFDQSNGQLLAQVFPGFRRLWRDNDRQTALREAVWWYLDSNANAGDRGIIMTQVALELLSWHFVVSERRMISSKSYGKLLAPDKLLLILSSLNIPVDIPKELTELGSCAKEFNWSDGPQAFTEIRNETVHPNHKKRGRLSGAKYECWKLGQWYAEMILLALCGHSGSYNDRLGIQQRGKVTTVPWAI